jgi:hypothetical protein
MFPVLLIAALVAGTTVPARGAEFSGWLEGQAFLFGRNAQFVEQSDRKLVPSLAAQFEVVGDLDDATSAKAVLFSRFDAVDSKRRHADVREAYVRHVADDFEIQAGVLKLFWGMVESNNLVDVINQIDVVEDFDYDEKLGQPGAQVKIPLGGGNFQFLALPYFRDRTFPGEKARFRYDLPVDSDNPLFESAARRHHVDFAARFSYPLEEGDIAVSHFRGTSREAVLRTAPGGGAAGFVLRPYYEIIDQTGLEAQMNLEGTIWKFEGIRRSGSGDPFFAMVAGAEHEFPMVFNSSYTLTPMLEVLWDGRDSKAPTTIFDNDIYVGARLALNDSDDTVLQLDDTIDWRSGGQLLRLKGERRIGSDWKLAAEINLFVGVRDDPLLWTYREDDHAMIRLRRFF